MEGRIFQEISGGGERESDREGHNKIPYKTTRDRRQEIDTHRRRIERGNMTTGCAIPWRKREEDIKSDDTSTSMQTAPDVVRDGDLVIVYERHDRMKALTVQSGKVFQNRFGVFDHNNWIGKGYGCQVFDRTGKRWVYLIKPNPELWTLVLPHRTQILYVADISMVITFLQLRPGSVVLESGTGSGSLTHSLARAVAPTGHVHTFEYHEERANVAREEFCDHGIDDIVSVSRRDIEGLGFPKELRNKADGVFLDLPGPWKVVTSAAACLRVGGVLCSFSPCIEQVQKTCTGLRELGFYGIETMEVILRPYDVREEFLRDFSMDADTKAGELDGRAYGVPSPNVKGHSGYLSFARKTNLTKL